MSEMESTVEPAFHPPRPGKSPLHEPVTREDLLKIGEFATLAGTNLRTLRYYEELGLLVPALRSDGGFRYYRPTDANRVRAIQFLQELGLPLERIGTLLATRIRDGADRQAWIRHVREALDEQRLLIDERISSLEAQKGRLQAAAIKLDLCHDCDNTPSPANNFCEPCARTGDPLPEFLSALF